jgi:hypothetical protein
MQFTHIVERYDEAVASYERLGFPRVLAWTSGRAERSTLFRAGPALVEVVEAATQPPERRPAGTAASGPGSSAPPTG